MKNKRITRAVSVVMLLALLIGVMPIVGLTGTVTAETTELSTQEETQVMEEQLTEQIAAPSEPTASDVDAEQNTAPTETEPPAEDTEPEPNTEAPTEPEPTQPEPIAGSLTEDSSLAAPPPAADEIQAAADAMLYKNYFLYGNGSTLSISFKYPGDTTNKTYTTSLQGMSCHFLNSVIAYCIEPQASSTAGDIYSEIAAGSGLNVWTKYLSAAQRSAITLALAYGAPNTLTSTNSLTRHGYEMATQVIVWEIIVGDRRTTPPYSRSNARLYNFYLPLMNTNDSSGVLRSAFIEGYNSIANAMKNHGKIPSFTSKGQSSAPKYSMSYNPSINRYTLTLTDMNEVLSDFTFRNGGGITYSKSGNTLTITATKAALTNAPVLVTATGKDPDSNGGTKVIWGTSASNHEVGQILVQMTHTDPIPVYFQLAPGPGSATMQKVSDDGGDVEGYAFLLRQEKDTDNGIAVKRFYGRSDADGKIYSTDSNYTIKTSGRTYTFDGLYDGNFRIAEMLSKGNNGNVYLTSITVSTSGGATAAYNRTFSGAEIHKNAGGDYYINATGVTGLKGGGTMTITFHNAPVPPDIPLSGEINILKTDTHDTGLADVLFCLEYSLDEGATWTPVSYREEGSPITVGGCTTEGVDEGLLMTGADGSLSYTGLCLDTEEVSILYRLTEIQTRDGYQLLAEPAFVGHLSPGENEIVDLTVVNVPEFEMPMTGSGGFAASTLALSLMLMAAAVLLLSLPKKRDDVN